MYGVIIAVLIGYFFAGVVMGISFASDAARYNESYLDEEGISPWEAFFIGLFMWLPFLIWANFTDRR